MSVKHKDYDDHHLIPKISLSHIATLLDVSLQAIHQKLRAKGLKASKLSNKSYVHHILSRELFNISFKKIKIAAQIVKGGPGKTTTIDAISSCAHAYGARCLLIDLDPQGNLTDVKNIDVDNHPVMIDVLNNDASIEESIVHLHTGLDMIPSRIENVVLANTINNKNLNIEKMFDFMLEGVIDNYDFIFIDTPPTLTKDISAVDLFIDKIIVPLNPEAFSEKGLSILQEELHMLNTQYRSDKNSINYKVFLNKFSGNTILSELALQKILSSDELKSRCLDVAVRLSQEIPNAANDKKNIFSYLKKSTARTDFELLTRQILEFDVGFNNKYEEKNKDKIEEEVI